MTRKKGIALIICLTLIISMALPGTLAFSGDPSATNENLTLADDTPVPTPENSVAEKGCTCDPQPAEGEAHQADCPLYTEPEVPAEEETTCTCNPQPAEGEPHREGCAFYTSVMGSTAPTEEPTTEEPTTEEPTTEEPTEETANINYVSVGPAGTSFGSVDPTSETVMVKSGTAVGSTPTSGTGFKFVGWFKDQACTQPVDAAWIVNNKITPQKTTEAYEAATYYAKFDYAVADLTIKQDGGIADENQTFIYVVTGGDLPESGIKVAVKGNSSVTIKNLKIGSYTVTEETNWNWRCGTTGGSQKITLQGAQTNNAVSFTNNVSNFKWLSGNAYSKFENE